jgi:putative heme-binding domain-containing protein
MRHSILAIALAGTMACAAPQRNPQSKSSQDGLSAVVAVLSQTKDQQLQIDILKGIREALKGRRTVPMAAGWESIEERLSGSPNLEARALSQSLSLTFGSVRALNDLRKVAQDKSAEIGLRRSAVESLLGVKDPGLPPVLQELLSEPGLRSPALRGLALYDDAKTPSEILSVYHQFNTSEKRDALATLTSRPAYAKPLLQGIEDKVVKPTDLTAELVRQLRSLKNPEINQQIEKVWGTFRETTADKKSEIERYRKIYAAGGSTPGDASRGRAIFTKTCQQCHTLFDVGGKVGPDLTGSNRGDLSYILQNIVDPNAVIPNDYRTSTLDLKDDRVITGIIRQQDDKSISIVTANESLVIPRNEVKSVQQGEISMMPEGLLAQLADQEVRDLIYYLGRPGQVPLPAGTK